MYSSPRPETGLGVAGIALPSRVTVTAGTGTSVSVLTSAGTVSIVLSR